MRATHSFHCAAPVSLGRLLMRSATATVLRIKRLVVSLGRGRRNAVSWPLDLSVCAASQARELTRQQLARWGLHEYADTSELLVSELVTNAIMHAWGPTILSMSMSPRNKRLRCCVRDACRTLPRPRWVAISSR